VRWRARDHVGRVRLQGLGREQRRHQLALPLPQIAVGREQPSPASFARLEAQHVRFVEVPGVLEEDLLHHLGALP